MSIPEDVLPDIAGKLVFVNFSRGGRDHQIVENGRFETQGGRVFLVGTVPQGIMPGFDGLRIGVCWHWVEQYFLFDSLEQCKKACVQLERARRRAKWRWRLAWLAGDV